MVLSSRDEVIFTDCAIQDYWDKQESFQVDHGVYLTINLKRLGLGMFPNIERHSGKIAVVETIDKSTTKEILHILKKTEDAYAVNAKASIGVSRL